MILVVVVGGVDNVDKRTEDGYSPYMWDWLSSYAHIFWKLKPSSKTPPVERF